jgi:hypothetical protein
MLLCNHIAEVEPDAELDAFGRRNARVAFGNTPLHLDCAAHGIYNAGELRQEPVASVFDQAAPVLGDLRKHQLGEVRLQPLVRALLVRTHQARVTRHIGGKDRG